MIKGNREIYEVSNLGKFIFLKGELKWKIGMHICVTLINAITARFQNALILLMKTTDCTKKEPR